MLIYTVSTLAQTCLAQITALTWRGIEGNQLVIEAQIQLVCIFGSGGSRLSLDNTLSHSLWGQGQAGWPSNQAR